MKFYIQLHGIDIFVPYEIDILPYSFNIKHINTTKLYFLTGRLLLSRSLGRNISHAYLWHDQETLLGLYFGGDSDKNEDYEKPSGGHTGQQIFFVSYRWVSARKTLLSMCFKRTRPRKSLLVDILYIYFYLNPCHFEFVFENIKMTFAFLSLSKPRCQCIWNISRRRHGFIYRSDSLCHQDFANSSIDLGHAENSGFSTNRLNYSARKRFSVSKSCMFHGSASDNKPLLQSALKRPPLTKTRVLCRVRGL